MRKVSLCYTPVQILAVYVGSLFSLTVLAWLLFIVFGVVQCWRPSISLTLLLLRLEKWLLPGQGCWCCRCACAPSCADPIYVAAIWSTAMIPLCVFLGGYVITGCTVVLRMTSLALIIIAAAFGLISALSWLTITMRFLVFSPSVRKRVLFGRPSTGGDLVGDAVSAGTTTDISVASTTSSSIGGGAGGTSAGVGAVVSRRYSNFRKNPESREQDHAGNEISPSSSSTASDKRSTLLPIDSSDTIVPGGTSAASSSPSASLLSLGGGARNDPSDLRAGATEQTDDVKGEQDGREAPTTNGSFDLDEGQQQRTSTGGILPPVQEELSRDSLLDDELEEVPVVRSRLSLVLVIFLSGFCAVVWEVQQRLDSYDQLRQEWDDNWGFLVKNGIAPVWVGEYGSGTFGGTGPGTNSDWLHKVWQYIGERNLDWGYWPINGDSYPGTDESFGLLRNDYVRLRDVRKLRMLSPLLNITVNATTGDAYPPGFGPDPDDVPPEDDQWTTAAPASIEGEEPSISRTSEDLAIAGGDPPRSSGEEVDVLMNMTAQDPWRKRPMALQEESSVHAEEQ